MSMVRFDQVSKRYGAAGKDALNGVNFELQRGELAFLTGHSGAGKSTLLKLMMMMERPTRGQIHIDDQLINTLKPSQVPYHRRKVG